jgi:hypothetical protein
LAAQVALDACPKNPRRVFVSDCGGLAAFPAQAKRSIGVDVALDASLGQSRSGFANAAACSNFTHLEFEGFCASSGARNVESDGDRPRPLR